MKYGVATVIIFIVISIILYLPLGYVEIPLYQIGTNIADLQSATVSTYLCTIGCSENSNAQVTFPITYPLYIITLVAFVGLFLFTLFGGIGFAALPIDLLNGFRLRPKRIPFKVYSIFQLVFFFSK